METMRKRKGYRERDSVKSGTLYPGTAIYYIRVYSGTRYTVLHVKHNSPYVERASISVLKYIQVFSNRSFIYTASYLYIDLLLFYKHVYR